MSKQFVRWRRTYQRHKKEAIGNSQRIITIARRRRGWTQATLAEKLWRITGDVSEIERGIRFAPWDELDHVMPELAEMWEHGCAFYCDTPEYCKEHCGKCKFDQKGHKGFTQVTQGERA